MSEERRSAPRARISGARVTYESAIGGDRVEADALNLGRGGLFVLTDRPLAIGKRIALEIQVAGELVPWAALGRVIWSRERNDTERRPAGMGVKLIDVEDDVLETIERLVEGRASELGDIPVDEEEVPAADVVTSPIVTVTPARERTILGVGLAPPGVEGAPQTPSPPDTPTPSPPAEPIVLREPLRPRDPRETGVPFDLVQKETTPSTPPAARRPASDSNPAQRPTSPPQRAFVSSRPYESPAAAPKRRGGQWTVVFLLIVVAAAAAYWVLGGDPDKLRPSEPAAAPVEGPVLPPPAPTPTEPASVTSPTAARPPPSASTVAPPTGAAPPPGGIAPGSSASNAPRRPATGYPPAYPVTIPSPPGHGPGMAADGGRRSATEENPY
jgi:uncharacterized protein (TIGR02266 family)